MFFLHRVAVRIYIILTYKKKITLSHYKHMPNLREIIDNN